MSRQPVSADHAPYDPPCFTVLGLFNTTSIWDFDLFFIVWGILRRINVVLLQSMAVYSLARVINNNNPQMVNGDWVGIEWPYKYLQMFLC